jgi:hypothetical protein
MADRITVTGNRITVMADRIGHPVNEGNARTGVVVPPVGGSCAAGPRFSAERGRKSASGAF